MIQWCRVKSSSLKTESCSLDLTTLRSLVTLTRAVLVARWGQKPGWSGLKNEKLPKDNSYF